MAVDVDGLMKWLSRFGELVTMGVRVSRECSGLCTDLSLRYLTIIIGLDLINLCNYLGYRLEINSCYDDIFKSCGATVAQDVLEIISISRKLSVNEYVELSVLEAIMSRLPETYLCLSRMVTTYISSRSFKITPT